MRAPGDRSAAISNAIRSFPPIEFTLENVSKHAFHQSSTFPSDNGIHCIGINKDPQDVLGANLMVNLM